MPGAPGSGHQTYKQTNTGRFADTKRKVYEIDSSIQGLGHAGFILAIVGTSRESNMMTGSFVRRSSDILNSVRLVSGCDGKLCRIVNIFISVEMKLRQSVMTGVARLQGKTSFWVTNELVKKSLATFAVAHMVRHLFLGRYATKIITNCMAIATNGCPTKRLIKMEHRTFGWLYSDVPQNCIYSRWHYEDPTILPHRLLLQWYRQHMIESNKNYCCVDRTQQRAFYAEANSECNIFGISMGLVAENPA